MNSTSTGLATIAATSCLVRDDYQRQIYKIINLLFNKFRYYRAPRLRYLLTTIISFIKWIRIILCYISPLLCPLPQADATMPPSHKQILGCMHLPTEPQRLMQIAIKYMNNIFKRIYKTHAFESISSLIFFNRIVIANY